MRGVFCAHTAGAIDDLGLRQPTSGRSALYREEGLNKCLPKANPILPQRTIPDAFRVTTHLLLSANGVCPSSPLQIHLAGRLAARGPTYVIFDRPAVRLARTLSAGWDESWGG